MRRILLLAALATGCAAKEKEWPLASHFNAGDEVVIVDQSLGEEGFPPDVLGKEDPSAWKFESIEQASAGRVVSDHRRPMVRLVAVRVMDGRQAGKVLWIQRSCLKPR